jgi:hypothetical protein
LLCDQVSDVAAIALLGALKPFSERPHIVITGFDCLFRENTRTGAIRKTTRCHVCHLLKAFHQMSKESRVNDNRNQIGASNFSSMNPSMAIASRVVVVSTEGVDAIAHDGHRGEVVLRIGIKNVASRLVEHKHVLEGGDVERKRKDADRLMQMLNIRAKVYASSQSAGAAIEPELSPQDRRSSFWMVRPVHLLL